MDNKITDQDLIIENERLENLFKHRIQNKKQIKENQIQFKYKLVDLLMVLIKGTETNALLKKEFFQQSHQLINKFCLGSEFEFLPRAKIISIIQ